MIDYYMYESARPTYYICLAPTYLLLLLLVLLKQVLLLSYRLYYREERQKNVFVGYDTRCHLPCPSVSE